jgi:hypothetical protein
MTFSPHRWLALLALIGLPGWGCLPDDPIDDNNPFGDDDDDFSPSDPEDCPIWAPEYKVGYERQYAVTDDSDRVATYTGLQPWQGGVYWQDEVFGVDLGAVETWVYDHCRDGKLYRVGMEEPDGTLTLFNPPVLQLSTELDPGSAWTSEYMLLFREFTERYEVQGIETLEIAAGTFDALHVSMRLSYVENGEPIILYWENYYVEELGLVAQESTTPTYFELVSYTMPEEWEAGD